MQYPNTRGVVGAVVVMAFLGLQGVVGVRGLVIDDSRWAWGMFPYVLKVAVVDVAFVDADGVVVGHWQMPKKRRPPAWLRPGQVDRSYGYGKGAFDDVVRRLGRHALQQAPEAAVACEVTITTKQSERAAVTETVRVERAP